MSVPFDYIDYPSLEAFKASCGPVSEVNHLRLNTLPCPNSLSDIYAPYMLSQEQAEAYRAELASVDINDPQSLQDAAKRAVEDVSLDRLMGQDHVDAKARALARWHEVRGFVIGINNVLCLERHMTVELCYSTEFAFNTIVQAGRIQDEHGYQYVFEGFHSPRLSFHLLIASGFLGKTEAKAVRAIWNDRENWSRGFSQALAPWVEG
jgi:hypothetical protein